MVVLTLLDNKIQMRKREYSLFFIKHNHTISIGRSIRAVLFCELKDLEAECGGNM
jgi:hypothetical protein